VGALGHFIEREGVPTGQISLIREQTAAIRPPRALWVPFMLGRPFGAPNAPDFQRDVLRALLRLFEHTSGPVLEDFPDDAPPDVAGETTFACPVSFAPAQTSINDPATAMDPARTWVLLADVAWSSASVIAAPGSGAGRSPAHDGNTSRDD